MYRREIHEKPRPIARLTWNWAVRVTMGQTMVKFRQIALRRHGLNEGRGQWAEHTTKRTSEMAVKKLRTTPDPSPCSFLKDTLKRWTHSGCWLELTRWNSQWSLRRLNNSGNNLSLSLSTWNTNNKTHVVSRVPNFHFGQNIESNKSERII